jgi:signal transduction histidine kinase/putative methionine-R-sulfoxide reductase with GAF domain
MSEVGTVSGAAPPPAPVRPRGRLFRKYVALFVAVVSVALVVNGALEIYFSYIEHRDALVRIQREQAEAAAAKIEQFVKEIESQLGWTTQLPWSTANLEQRRVDALRLLRQVPAITELAQLDPSGHEQLRVSRLAMDVVGSGADFSHDPKFTAVTEDKESAGDRARKVYYGPVYFRRESEPYMTLSLAGTSRAAGVSVAEVNLKFIWDVVSQIKVGEHGQAYVVDADGRLIAHPDISLVLRNTDLSGLAQVRAARAGAGGEETQFAQNIQGARVLSAHAAIAPLGWIVFVELPQDEAYAPLYASIERSGSLLLAGLLLAFLAGLALARRMVVPIEALRAGAARIGGGDLGQRIAVNTGDELEALAHQFNDMAGQLRESYADLERKVELRTRELSEALEQQTATAEVLQVISASPGDLKPVFEIMLANATRICEAEFATLYRYENDAFVPVATVGVPPAFAEYMKQSARRPPTLYRVAERKATVHVLDLAAEQPYLERHPDRVAIVELGGARTLVAVPMLKENALVGVFSIYRKEVRPFTETQIELVTNFANQAVIAIENVRLLNELRESLDRQIATSEVLRVISSSPGELQPVFDAILANATRICDANFAVLRRLDGDSLDVAATRGVPRAFAEYLRESTGKVQPQIAVARAALSRAPIQVADAMEGKPYRERDPLAVAAVELGGARTMLVVPMLKENETVGAITIYRQEKRAFSEKEIELVTSFANQAVIAIENVRLLSELRERTTELARSVEELRALGEVSQAVNSTLDVETVLATIVAKAVQISGTDAGAIYVYDRAHGGFNLRATHGMDEALIEAIRGQRSGVADSRIGRAAAQRSPVQVPDLMEEPPSPVTDLILDAGFRAVLAVPLLSPDAIVGMLVVRRRATGAFAKASIDLLQTFAAQSVLAIQNARLFREIEEKGRQLEVASRHKSQFLANMSHELRTPLNAILGYTELLIDGIYGELANKARGVLERVQTNGKHLLGLINDVLDLSKIEAGQLTLAVDDYSLPALLKSVVATTEPLARAKGLSLAAAVPDGLPMGRGDERRLTQVLLNLVGNAVKFTDKGTVAIAASAADGRFTIAVSDSGPGIADADQARIFEEFQQVDNTDTRKKGGTGLGLAIARRIMEMHGGTLTVESAPGRGSTFRMILPIRVERGKEAA